MNEDMTEEKKEETPVEKTAAPAEKSEAKQMKMKGAIVASVVVLVIVAVVLVSYALVYRVSGNSAYEQWVASTFNLPVAKVNGEKLLLAEFNENVEATEHFFQQQDAQALGLVAELGGEEIREQELEAMINSALLEGLASERGIEVTDEEIDTYFDEVVVPQAPGGLDEVTTTLADLYNWTPEEFKTSVLGDIVLQQELQTYLSEDEEANGELLTAITSIREDILADNIEGFSDYAERYSQDPGSAANGGSLGSFGKGVMVAEFEEAAFATAVGEISEPVKTVFGYHIVLVTSRDDEAETLEASHILLTFNTIDSLLQDAKDEAEIEKYLPVYEEAEEDDEEDEPEVEVEVSEEETEEEQIEEEGSEE